MSRKDPPSEWGFLSGERDPLVGFLENGVPVDVLFFITGGLSRILHVYFSRGKLRPCPSGKPRIPPRAGRGSTLPEEIVVMRQFTFPIAFAFALCKRF